MLLLSLSFSCTCCFRWIQIGKSNSHLFSVSQICMVGFMVSPSTWRVCVGCYIKQPVGVCITHLTFKHGRQGGKGYQTSHLGQEHVVVCITTFKQGGQGYQTSHLGQQPVGVCITTFKQGGQGYQTSHLWQQPVGAFNHQLQAGRAGLPNISFRATACWCI